MVETGRTQQVEAIRAEKHMGIGENVKKDYMYILYIYNSTIQICAV